MTTTTIAVAKEFGTDLSSRQTAAKLRGHIEGLVGTASAAGKIGLDLFGLRSVSHSFADELFAVLVEKHGDEWFRTHIQVVNASPAVRTAILEAIAQRLEPSLLSE